MSYKITYAISIFRAVSRSTMGHASSACQGTISEMGSVYLTSIVSVYRTGNVLSVFKGIRYNWMEYARKMSLTTVLLRRMGIVWSVMLGIWRLNCMGRLIVYWRGLYTVDVLQSSIHARNVRLDFSLKMMGCVMLNTVNCHKPCLDFHYEHAVHATHTTSSTLPIDSVSYTTAIPLHATNPQ
mgnify:FL=1